MDNALLPDELIRILLKEKYQLVGKHSAVKKCRWLHKSLLNEGVCYKQKFYGIESWRCLQMTPSIAHCTMRCLYCWRIQDLDMGTVLEESPMRDWDSPSLIVEGAIKAQKRILSGYGAHPRRDDRRYVEALMPKHAAISLAGEPTLYPELSSLVKEFHKRGFTTFVVTNGTIPKALEELSEEPSQLYVTLPAPNVSVFKRVCRPRIPDAWQKLQRSLELLTSFSCPTVVRLTLVRHLNLKDAEGYAKLIRSTKPTYVEAKGYVYVGMSRRRLKFKNMPTHTDIKDFGEVLSKLIGYRVIGESPPSRVLLMSKLERPIKIV